LNQTKFAFMALASKPFDQTLESKQG